ncbi:M20/M25/M40 family metallo-hydrolase [bacterium]|nr:M20/M25/M40 family metallo-hydrolase [bacterium]
MTRRCTVLFIGCFLAFLDPSTGRAAELLHHDISVQLDPENHRLAVRDEISLPPSLPGSRNQPLIYFLHPGLSPLSPTPGVTLTRLAEHDFLPEFEAFEVSLPDGRSVFTVEYEGTIDHPLMQVGEEYARGQRRTSGKIGPEGVYLSSSSGWYPLFPGELFSFTLTVEVPGGWDAVSQGVRTFHTRDDGRTRVTWKAARPQDDLFLVAGPYLEYSRESGPLRAMVFLRSDDAALADRYLDATLQYIEMYSDLIGAYPYGKFALVENFWETGYGMPSFTLLGPKVTRFPFILHSSYPHEILHNWWGNSVYIDYQSGNWGEGLTAYLSDHLIKEQRGAAAEYRQTVLQKYTDYVLKERDLPLTDFRSRHGSVSEAVGYGKTLMLFHMLRRKLGDEPFSRALQDFYREFTFRTASFGDLRQAFEKSSGLGLEGFFEQWVTRTGAPELRLEAGKVSPQGERYLLEGAILQVQDEESLFSAEVPLAVTLAGHDEAFVTSVHLEGRRTPFEVSLPAPPRRVDVDPEFDLFRRLHPDEIPPALTRAFGADRALILLPAAAEKDVLDMYRELAEHLRATGPGSVTILSDDSVETLPSDRSVWLLGWENRFFNEVPSSLDGYDASFQNGKVRFGKTRLERAGHSFVVTSRHPSNPDLAMLWIGTDNPAAVAGLGRKLPHYHKYSYLAFEGDEPSNVAKGRWSATDSPLSALIPDAAGAEPSPVKRARLPERRPLAELKPLFSGEKMMETIRFLSGTDLDGRGFASPGLDRAASFIAEHFAESGLLPGGGEDEGYFQSWLHRDEDLPRGIILKNVIGIIPGSREEWSDQSIILGAHYDHLGRGLASGESDVRKGNEGSVHPGADDNASGVAVLMELARVLGGTWKPERTILFAAFTGEEAGKIGSRRFVEHYERFPIDACRGMLNLDTVGRLRGNKLLVLGGDSAREWVHILRGAGYLTGIDVEMVTENLDSSDHISFQERGVPAVQLFCGPHLDYHRPSDTAEKIDAAGLVKIASITKEILEYLAGREDPLSKTGSGPPVRGRDREGGQRRSSLGTVPDFSYSGGGVRLEGVVPGSPAERAGLRGGDVINAVGDTEVVSLRDLSSILKTFDPGSRVSVTFSRDGRRREVEAVLEER